MIDPEYLNLLRRVVEGFFPKPQQACSRWICKRGGDRKGGTQRFIRSGGKSQRGRTVL